MHTAITITELEMEISATMTVVGETCMVTNMAITNTKEAKAKLTMASVPIIALDRAIRTFTMLTMVDMVINMEQRILTALAMVITMAFTVLQ